MRRLLLALLLALSTGVLPAGTGPVAAKDELVIGTTQYPSTLHPMIDAMLAKTYVLSMALRPVVSHDKYWNLACMLCTELPTIENGKARVETLPDGKQGLAITYTIHPNASWGDGTPVTVDDVIFAWEIGRNPRVGVPDGEPFRRVIRIEVHDRKTYTVHTDKLHYQYASQFSVGVMPAHIDRKNFGEPENYHKRSAYDTDPTNPGLYFGPYRIVQVVPGSHVALEQNPTWYGRKPHFKRIVVRAIENTAALEANLLSGSIDYIAGELGLSLDQALAFEKRYKDRFDITYKPGLIYEHIDFNLEQPILKDVRVRQALLHGLDREAISKQLFEGKQPVAHSFVNALDWIADDTLPKYPFDVARATKLLEEGGWTRLQGGIRHNAAGEKLSIEIMTTAGNRSRETVQQVLQSQWRRIGVELRIRNEPPRVAMGETLRQRRFMTMMYAWYSPPESLPRSILHSESIPTQANNWSGQNFTGFKNAEMDELLGRIETELDRAKRGVLWRRLQEIYITELPVLPLYFRADPFVIPKWLTGVEPTGHSGISTYAVENWGAR
jgi:peptide/nickel transport system substrate-binding protein